MFSLRIAIVIQKQELLEFPSQQISTKATVFT